MTASIWSRCRPSAPSACGNAPVSPIEPAASEELDAAERRASGDHGALRGELHVTAPIAFGERHLLPIALEFLKEQPDINLRLTLADRQLSLADEHVGVALRIGHLADSALIATRVGTVRRVICASPDYLARFPIICAPARCRNC